ncbi:6-bladed beta-propeller [bacterium]|nr:6-bladed beta-propeller [bacterium]
MAFDPGKGLKRPVFQLFCLAILGIVEWTSGGSGVNSCQAQESSAKAVKLPDKLAIPTPGQPIELDVSWPKSPNDGPAWGEMSGLCLDHEGHIWAFHRGDVPVEIYDKSGERLKAWGEGQFGRPHQVRVDDQGHVWLVDAGLHVVRKYDLTGKLLLTLGTSGVAGEDSTHFDQPTDVAVAPTGEIFVADGYGNHRVVKFDAQGQFVKAWGKKGTAPGEFDLPHSIALDSKGRLYVADRSNGRVQVFDFEGTFLAEWAGKMMPWHIVVMPGDVIYVCGSSFMPKPRLSIPGIPRGIPPKDQIVATFDVTGRELERWTFPIGRKPGQLEWVHAMAVDGEGNLYLGDIRGRRAQRFVLRSGVFAERAKSDAAVKRAGGEKPR